MQLVLKTKLYKIWETMRCLSKAGLQLVIVMLSHSLKHTRLWYFRVTEDQLFQWIATLRQTTKCWVLRFYVICISAAESTVFSVSVLNFWALQSHLRLSMSSDKIKCSWCAFYFTDEWSESVRMTHILCLALLLICIIKHTQGVA